MDISPLNYLFLAQSYNNEQQNPIVNRQLDFPLTYVEHTKRDRRRRRQRHFHFLFSLRMSLSKEDIRN